VNEPGQRLVQPYTFEPTATAAGLAGEYGSLDPGSETGTEVTIAGRLMLRRVQGKLAFGTLQDPPDESSCSPPRRSPRFR
jgi:lysyl-tRNA synthetase class 2